MRRLMELEPPVDDPGQWVLLEDMNARKSFGWFQCTCRHTWRSAHAFRDYRQGCQSCETMTPPWAMWQNVWRPRAHEENAEEEEGSDSSESTEDGPHDVNRCEAGLVGLCEVCNRIRDNLGRENY